MRLQGFEPWTPWLRVRCSTNWAKDAYQLFVFRFFRSSRHVVLYVMVRVKSTPFFNFFYFFLFYFLYLHLMQFCWVFFLFLPANFWSGLPGFWCYGLHYWNFAVMSWIFFFSSFSFSFYSCWSGLCSCRVVNFFLTQFFSSFYYMKTGRSVYRSAWFFLHLASSISA